MKFRPYFCGPKTGGDVAQSVEQRTENPCVVGSIPIVPTNLKATPLCGFFYFFSVLYRWRVLACRLFPTFSSLLKIRK